MSEIYAHLLLCTHFFWLKALSEAQVRKEFADEDAKVLKDGGSFPNETTASMFITMGLELEEAQ